MFEIQLKFYDKYWENYFHKRYNKEEAFELFDKLTKNFPNSQWRLIYKED